MRANEASTDDGERACATVALRVLPRATRTVVAVLGSVA